MKLPLSPEQFGFELPFIYFHLGLSCMCILWLLIEQCVVEHSKAFGEGVLLILWKTEGAN